MKHLIAATLLTLLSTHMSAEIYRSVDQRGNTVFSDTPQEGSQKIDLTPANTTPAVTPSADPAPPPKPAVSEDIPQLQILTPHDGQVLANGLTGTRISVSLSKPLPPGYQIEYRLDGELLQRGRQSELSIPRLNRGQRRLSAQLIDPRKRTQSQDTVTITVYWPNN